MYWTSELSAHSLLLLPAATTLKKTEKWADIWLHNTQMLNWLCLSSVFQVILGAMLSLGNASEMQFDRSCPMFLHRCHRILLVLRLISAPDDFRELTELPDFVCFGK